MLVIAGAVLLFVGLTVDKSKWWKPLAILFGLICAVIGAL